MVESPPRELAPRHERPFVVTLFVIYFVLLAWMVLWKFEAPYIGEAAGLPRPFKLIPFASVAEAGASAPLEVMANVALFVPFGFYLGLVAPSWKWWRATAIFAGASLAFEIVQHVISVGVFDVTDVISNAAGGLLGFVLLARIRRGLGERTITVVTRYMVAATALALVGVGIYMAGSVRYHPPHDVIVPLPAASN